MAVNCGLRFPVIAGHDAAHEFIKQRDRESGIAVAGAPDHAFGDQLVAGRPERGDLALVVLPTLMVGNELLILGGVGLAVGAWFLAHRHGELRGMVAASSADSVKRE